MPDFLHIALAQGLVFPGEQLLREIVAALIGVATCPGEGGTCFRMSGRAEAHPSATLSGWEPNSRVRQDA